MNKLKSLPLWQQYALGAAWLLPWVAFGILASHVLPESCRFQKWPVLVQGVCLVLFCIFILADLLFSVWCLFLYSHDDDPTP